MASYPREVDYLVVGAGSAGCVVAHRLSGDPNVSVALLEAGGRDWNPFIQVPVMTRTLFPMPTLNWGYQTEAEPHLEGRSLNWPRGRVLGGSSSINGMTYIRGHRRDFDIWRQLGCEGWSYEEVLPYFVRAERNPGKDSPYHGKDGPLGVSRAPYLHPLDAAFMQACRDMGYRQTADFNGAEQEGFNLHDFTVLNGRRQSTARAYLKPIRDRANLHVVTHAQATRVTVEEGRATAVEFLQGGTPQRIRVRREIVLSGGTINSPQLLMLSGIGDAEALRGHGIAPLHHLPAVGQNLQDHLGFYIAQECTQPVSLRNLMRPDRAAAAVLQALFFGTGPGTAIPINACAFLRTRPELEIPDIQVTLIPGLVVNKAWRRPDKHGFLVHAYQLRPESRGSIVLRSSDPLAKPVIRANYLATEGDRRTLRDSMHLLRRMIAQAGFAAYRGPELSPGPAIASAAEIDRWIRQNAASAYHPVGTCRMGGDETSVVDPQLRVRGVRGLRVADASVMPLIVGGNTNAAAIMIGEKAADLILGRSLPRAELAA